MREPNSFTNMGSSRQKMPQKEPIFILDRWERLIVNCDLHSGLHILQDLLNGRDLKWDQQMALLRKLEKEITKHAVRDDEQLRHQMERILLPVVNEAYFVAPEALSRRYLISLIELAQHMGIERNLFSMTYSQFLENKEPFTNLSVTHRATLIATMLEHKMGIQAIEKNFNATILYLLSNLKTLQNSHPNFNAKISSVPDNSTEWPLGRPVDVLLADAQHILKSLLAVLSKGNYEQNQVMRENFQQDKDLLKDLLQTTLAIFSLQEQYNIDCLQVAGMVIVASVNAIVDVDSSLQLLIGWFFETPETTNDLATQYADCLNLTFPQSLVGDAGWTTSDSPMLMIVRGMVSNMGMSASLHHVDIKVPRQKLLSVDPEANFLQLCFQALSIFCSNSKLEPQCKVIAFDAMAIWLQRIKTLLKEDIVSEDIRVLDRVLSGEVRERLVTYAWSHWDDPVDAIQHKVKAIFELLLEVLKLQSEILHKEEQYQLFVRNLLCQLLAMDWHRKVKYALLSLLLPSLSTSIILELQPDFIWRCLSAMDNMSILPRVSALLCQFLEKRLSETVPQYRKNKTQKGGKVESEGGVEVQGWVDLWLTPVLRALSSSSDILRRNTSHTILMPMLQFYPSSVWRIMSILQDENAFMQYTGKESQQYQLNAFISVIKVARKLDIIEADSYSEDHKGSANTISLPLLRAAMDHIDVQVRIDVLGLICESKKSGSYITETELRLLEDFLPLNLNSTSPEFRQNMYSELTKFFTKLRGNLFSQYRKQLSTQKFAENEGVSAQKRQLASEEANALRSQIQFSKEFLNRLIGLMFTSLHPGASFQRAFTVLRILSSFVGIFGVTEVPTPEGFVGNPIFPFSIDLATKRHTKILISMLMDSYDQNRNLAFNLLMQFPSPLPGYEQAATVQRLLWWGLEKVRSKRAGESDSGAMVFRLVFRSYIATANFDLEVEEHTIENSLSHTGNQEMPVILRFAWKLTDLIEKQLKVAKDNILLAAQEHPMHGSLLALRYLFQELDYSKLVDSTNRNLWQAINERIVDLACEISDVVLDVLSNPSPEGNMPASFQEIEEALDDIIEENQDEDNESGSSPKHQVILSSCWRAIKEASTLLEAMITHIPLPRYSEKPLISENHLLRCGNLLRTLLMCIRHRGAFSAVYPAYISLCSRLLMSSNAELAKMPFNWLEENILSITSSSISVTRRSAGLPLCIMAIISSETSGRKSMLQMTMRKLIEIASATISADANQTVDAPQVHAYNIMRVILMDSKLGNDAIAFAEEVFHLAIAGFSSPSWAIRNCSVMLFSTLLQRTLGVKKTRDEHSTLNLLTATEFFTRFPQLRPYLVEQLTEAVEQLIGTETSRVHPGLYPILTLLSRLQPSSVDSQAQKESLSAIVPLVTSCSPSTIYKTREMAARALVPLISSETVIAVVSEILESSNLNDQNKLHGKLLQCQYLLRGHLYKKDSYNLWCSAVTELSIVLLSRFQLLLVHNDCPITKSLLLDIILEFFVVCDIPSIEDDSVFKEFQDLCSDNLTVFRTHIVNYCKHDLLTLPIDIARESPVAGSYLLRQKQAEILATSYLKCVPVQITLPKDLIVQLLGISIYEVRLSTIQLASKMLKESGQEISHDRDLQRKLCAMIYEEESHLECFRHAVLLLTHINPSNPYLDDSTMAFSIDEFWTRVVKQMQSSRNQSSQEAILPLMGSLLAQILKTHHGSLSSLQFFRTWTATFCKYSEADVTLPLREAATSSFVFMASYIFNNVQEIRKGKLVDEIVSTYIAITQLLQDDDLDVRLEMAGIVSSATGLKMDVQPEKALEIVYHHLKRNYGDCEGLQSAIENKLTNFNSIGVIGINEEVSKVLFEQESPNIFREPLIDSQWCALLLENIEKRGVSQQVALKSLSDYKVIAEAFKRDQIISYGPFGIMQRKDIFLAIYNVIILTNARLHQLIAMNRSDSIVRPLRELQSALVEMPRESLPPALIDVIEGPGGTSSLIKVLLRDNENHVESRNADSLPKANPYFLIKCHNI